jgi:hypothetical protein
LPDHAVHTLCGKTESEGGMRTLSCGCRFRGEGLEAEVVEACPEGQAAIDGLEWDGNWLMTTGAAWERYAEHFQELEKLLAPERNPLVPPELAETFLEADA